MVRWGLWQNLSRWLLLPEVFRVARGRLNLFSTGYAIMKMLPCMNFGVVPEAKRLLVVSLWERPRIGNVRRIMRGEYSGSEMGVSVCERLLPRD